MGYTLSENMNSLQYLLLLHRRSFGITYERPNKNEHFNCMKMVSCIRERVGERGRQRETDGGRDGGRVRKSKRGGQV